MVYHGVLGMVLRLSGKLNLSFVTSSLTFYHLLFISEQIDNNWIELSVVKFINPTRGDI